SEAGIESGLRKLYLDVPARTVVSAHAHFAAQLRRARGDGPRRSRARGEADPVVVDRDVHPLGALVDLDRGRVRARVESDVTGPLEHDLKGMLDQRKRPVELHPDGEARPRVERA